jgi:hypothetical protein
VLLINYAFHFALQLPLYKLDSRTNAHNSSSKVSVISCPILTETGMDQKLLNFAVYNFMKICSSILKFLSRLLVDGQRKSIFNRTSAGTRKHASHSPPTALRPNKHLKPVALNINSPAWTQKIFGAGVSRRFVGALGGRACAASLCLTEQTASHVGRGQHVLLE